MPSPETLYCMVQQSVRRPLAHARRWGPLLGTWQMAAVGCAVRRDGVRSGTRPPCSKAGQRSQATESKSGKPGGGGAQASVTSMSCSRLSRVTSFAFFLPPSCCFFCFFDGSWSMGAGFTNGISSWRPAGKSTLSDLSFLSEPQTSATTVDVILSVEGHPQMEGPLYSFSPV